MDDNVSKENRRHLESNMRTLLSKQNLKKMLKRENLSDEQILMHFAKQWKAFEIYEGIYSGFESGGMSEEISKINKIVALTQKDEKVPNKIVSLIDDIVERELKNFKYWEARQYITRLKKFNSLRKQLIKAMKLSYMAEIYGYIRRGDTHVYEILKNFVRENY